MISMKLSGKKKMRNILFVVFIIFALLISRVRLYTNNRGNGA